MRYFVYNIFNHIRTGSRTFLFHQSVNDSELLFGLILELWCSLSFTISNTNYGAAGPSHPVGHSVPGWTLRCCWMLTQCPGASLILRASAKNFSRSSLYTKNASTQLHASARLWEVMSSTFSSGTWVLELPSKHTSRLSLLISSPRFGARTQFEKLTVHVSLEEGRYQNWQSARSRYCTTPHLGPAWNVEVAARIFPFPIWGSLFGSYCTFSSTKYGSVIGLVESDWMDHSFKSEIFWESLS